MDMAFGPLVPRMSHGGVIFSCGHTGPCAFPPSLVPFFDSLCCGRRAVVGQCQNVRKKHIDYVRVGSTNLFHFYCLVTCIECYLPEAKSNKEKRRKETRTKDKSKINRKEKTKTKTKQKQNEQTSKQANKRTNTQTNSNTVAFGCHNSYRCTYSVHMRYCIDLLLRPPSPFMTFPPLHDFPETYRRQPPDILSRALDIHRKLADLRIVCMHGQLEDPHVAKHLAAVKAANH